MWTSKLIEPTELAEYFQTSKEWRVFWTSFSEVFFKNYWNVDNKDYLTPIIFKIDTDKGVKFAWKITSLWADSIEVDLYKDLYESESLLLLMSCIVRDYLETKFQDFWNMNFKEIALTLWDKQFIVWERVRQMLTRLCWELQVLLDNKWEWNLY